jgi:hypothetical protein
MSQVDFFRGSEAKGKKEITVENYEIIKKVLSNIRFKKSLNEDWQVANVTLEEVPLVHFECASVILGIPEKFRSYLLWQLGYGDWQQILMLDGRPIPTSMSLIDGISGAHEIFKQTNKLSHGQAAKAWETKLLPEKDSYNGITYDATEQIKRAISAYFSSKIGKQLNLIDQYRDRISHVILSGGSSKDEHVVEILRHELEAEGLKLITIQQIMEKNDLPIKDPSFATIAGISKNATLSIDIGNSYVKSGLRV